ncbi:UDP-N-acetylmuramate dehydrogenase [Blautia sp. An46]|uniref:UDP-N-acetylmuramate dehydrogenase n=1 Tax=Blautia sp. An46 TaxID=1965636 RepID=UPI000B3904D6|nr:UDP-N-acetylmuramate dehydrogenase [Blautia sp. An46]OUN92580.1 UDP-N-acetylenolpyruvoylglucosamine reductase [Blautia sp. An46]
MDYNKIENKFCACLGSDNVYRNEPMRKHTTFRIGGPADFYLCPHSAKEIQKTVAICREEELPYFILGNGSNLLVSDQGYRGVVIQLWKNVSDILVEGCRIRAKAGASLAKIAGEALEEGLTGMEFAAGIPGTLGGAVVMNAGAYGGEMKDILQEALVMDEQGEIFTLKKEELHLGYRTSIIKEKGYIVLAAALELKPGDRKEIKEKMDELKQRRVEKQPLDMPSAGSTFKRPEGYFAGKLIMDAGLRGFSVGGAQISEKHCGFVVNTGKATANDVLTLIREVQKRVRDKFGVELETEVKFLGEF